MNAKLTSITRGCGEHEGKTAEEIILYTARVSNPGNQDSKATSLLRYCWDHGHVSIFDMADMTIEIETSRAISAQIIRHRSFNFQEFSQRYAAVPGYEPYELHGQHPTNRQSSIELVSTPELDEIKNDLETYLEDGQELYQRMLAAGVAREDARFHLPMASTSKLYMKGSARSWIFYLQVRTGNGTQQAHVDVAKACQAIFKDQFPITAEAMGLHR